MRLAGLTDIGRVRETNEDSFCLERLDEGRDVWLLAVADGLGGCNAGEVASQLAIGTLREQIRASDGSWSRDLASAIQTAHRRIADRAATDGGLAGMGTTLTAVVTEGRQLYWGHVGDSRAYLLRGGELALLTRDHSVVGALLADGWIGEEAARQHPQRNVLTQALGFPGELQVETGSTTLAPGEWLLVTTDGLTAVAEGPDLVLQARDAPEPLVLCQRLVALANRRGGPDNITVLAAQA